MESTRFPPFRSHTQGLHAGSEVVQTDLAGLVKRPAMDNHNLQHQQQLQQAVFMRYVKQRTMQNQQQFSPVSTLYSQIDQNNINNSLPPPPPPHTVDKNSSISSLSMRNQLQELERRLLLDVDEEVEEMSSTASTTNIITPLSRGNQIMHSPSPTDSSTSTVTTSSSSSRQLLIDTATAIAEGNVEIASANLSALKSAANPRGDPEQRLTAMMLAALICRSNNQTNQTTGLCNQEHFLATQLLYNLSPCFKMPLIAAGHIILEATMERSKIHIVDLEVSQGCHYVALLKSIADRRKPTPEIKITAVTDPSSPFTNTNSANLRAVADRIEKLGENHGVTVRFNIVSLRPAELELAAIACEPDEALAVNLPFVLSRVPDESVSLANPRDELLRRVRALNPCVIVLVEQELNTNTAPFVSRFNDACGYYGSLLDSLNGSADSAERIRVEAGLARRAVNSVAREGSHRVERCEVFGKWKARMGMAGLRPVQIGPAVVEPVRSRLVSAVQPNHGFTIVDEFGGVGLGFGWMGRVLTVASAWR